MMKAYIMNELLALFNQIRRLEIITPQGQAGILAKESNFVFNYHQSVPVDAAVVRGLHQFPRDGVADLFAEGEPGAQ